MAAAKKSIPKAKCGGSMPKKAMGGKVTPVKKAMGGKMKKSC